MQYKYKRITCRDYVRNALLFPTFSLFVSISKRSSLAKIWGVTATPVPPVFTDLYYSSFTKIFSFLNITTFTVYANYAYLMYNYNSSALTITNSGCISITWLYLNANSLQGSL